MTNSELITQAATVIHERKIGEYTVANVGCALVSRSGKVYVGANIDTGSSMGYCAEQNTIGTMVSEGTYQIKKIVAVWKDKEGAVYVIPPCGKCREFIKRIDEGNLETDIILDIDKTIKLKDLLPYHDWWKKV